MLRQATRGIRQYGTGQRYGKAAKPAPLRVVRSRPASDGGNDDTPSRAELGIAKKKCALVISYIGSNYHGLQLASQPGIVTVESILVKALVDINAIRRTNAVDLKKIDWSRSSRTDKGVHAARLIISAKLEIPTEWRVKVEGSYAPEGKFPQLVELLNAQLPPDIRAMSCVQVSKSFRARLDCIWREYEYVLPTDLLRWPVKLPSPGEEDPTQPGFDLSPESIAARYSAFDCTKQTEEEALNRLNAALDQFVGMQDFHNFNNLKGKTLREAKARKARPTKEGHGQFNDEGASSVLLTDEDGVESAELASLTDFAQEDPDASSDVEEGDEYGEDDSLEDQLQGTMTTTANSTSNNVDNDGVGSLDAVDAAKKRFVFSPVHDEWLPEERKITESMRRALYLVRGELRRTADGQSIIAVTLRGNGFVFK